MVESAAAFHFEQVWWLLALLLPFVLWWVPQAELRAEYRDRVKRFADSHLLPHLILNNNTESDKRRWSFYLWSLIWVMAVLAMAGPRWDYRDVFIAKPTTDLVVLLDMSRSMEAQDVRPSRFVRARQEIEDLLRQQRNVRVGLIGFASVPHVIAPVTDDFQTLFHILPALSPKLVRKEFSGSRLKAALDAAQRLLFSQPAGNAKAILLIGDGDYAQPDLTHKIETLHGVGVRFFVLGIGTPEGAKILDAQGQALRDQQGREVLSQLDEVGLQALATLGQGVYLRADYRSEDTHALLDQIVRQTRIQSSSDTMRVWNERFYLPLFVLLLFLLYRFVRRQNLGH